MYDFKQGFMHNNFRLLMPVGLGILGPLLFYRIYTMVYGSIEGATILECIMYIYKGERFLTPEQIKDMYVLPAYWLGIQIMIGFLIGYYPVCDLHTYGQQVLIRSRNRGIWWISKCVWNVVTVLYCYVVMDVMIVIMCKLLGVSFSLTYTEEVFLGTVLEMYPCTGSIRQILIYTLVMPVVVSVAVSLMQMALSLIASPMVGFIAVQSMAVLATLVISPLLLHNFGTLARTNIASPAQIDYVTGCRECLVLAIVSIVLGGLFFRRYNILAKE